MPSGRFKYLGVLFMNEGNMEREIDRRISAAEPKGKAFNVLVGLRSNPHLWSRTLGSDRKSKVEIQADTMSFLRRTQR